jgi:antitoxin (DNA-binding transcriptional repressor) of toxin-antitoxin stability system
MKTANIGELKNNLSKFIGLVENRETIAICKRNVPIAHIVPRTPRKTGNSTKLGCGRGTVQVLGDVTEHCIPMESWEMHKP